MERFFPRQRVDAVLALVIGHERDLRRFLIVQDDRRHVAGQGVGVLLQFAVLQVQRPDVVDVAVARDFRIDRLVRVGRGRREHDRVRVHELGAAVVVRAEGDLRFLPGGEVDPEQLVVAAHACEVDDRLAVGRVGGCVVAEVVVGDVADFPGLEIDDEDVAQSRRAVRRRPLPCRPG